jgi:hypothetical protein
MCHLDCRLHPLYHLHPIEMEMSSKIACSDIVKPAHKTEMGPLCRKKIKALELNVLNHDRARP